MTPSDLVGKAVALLTKSKSAGGEDDWAVFGASRVRHVEPDLETMLLGADYVLPLSIGDVTDEESAELERNISGLARQ